MWTLICDTLCGRFTLGVFVDKNPYVRLRELCGLSQKKFWEDDDGVSGVWDVYGCV